MPKPSKVAKKPASPSPKPKGVAQMFLIVQLQFVSSPIKQPPETTGSFTTAKNMFECLVMIPTQTMISNK